MAISIYLPVLFRAEYSDSFETLKHRKSNSKQVAHGEDQCTGVPHLIWVVLASFSSSKEPLLNILPSLYMLHINNTSYFNYFVIMLAKLILH